MNIDYRSASIVSQVCLKCATEIVIKKDLDHEDPEFEKHLQMIMDDLIGAYQYGVKKLEATNES